MNESTNLLDSVVDTSDDASAPESRRRGALLLFLGMLAMFGLGAFLTSWRTPYLVIEPGSTFETEDFIEVEGTTEFPNPEGEVYFVTVTQRRVSPAGWVISKLSDSDRVFHEDELLRGRTIEEQREENAQLMLSSQNIAISAALSYLGYEVAEPAGAVVIDVVEGGALEGVIGRNDVVTALDGSPILTVEELFDAIDARAIGDTITLTVGRPGAETRDVEVALTDETAAFLGVQRAADAEDDGDGARIDAIVPGGPSDGLLTGGDTIVSVADTDIESFDDLVAVLRQRRAGDEVVVEALRISNGATERVEGSIVLGSRVFERAGLANVATQFRDATLPFEVDIATENIGGPSAGLAFTLTVLDVLTDGDLTGGSDVVVTGTIDRAGNVGGIGGVHQKAFAARGRGADVFIVPRVNLEEARAAVDDLRIEPVDNLEQALAVIADLGGNALELPRDASLVG